MWAGVGKSSERRSQHILSVQWKSELVCFCLCSLPGHLQISVTGQQPPEGSHGERVRSNPADEPMVDTPTHQSSIAIDCQFDQWLDC